MKEFMSKAAKTTGLVLGAAGCYAMAGLYLTMTAVWCLYGTACLGAIGEDEKSESVSIEVEELYKN